MNLKTLGVIGLAQRAGELTHGTEHTLEAIRKNKAKLVLVAKDVSANTRKTLFDKATFYSVNIEETDITAEELGKAIGKKVAAAIGFTDEGFVTAYKKSLMAKNNADFGERD